MPRNNGTGPMTGGTRGDCQSKDDKSRTPFSGPMGRGMGGGGRGMGGGRGLGGGRGMADVPSPGRSPESIVKRMGRGLGGLGRGLRQGLGLGSAPSAEPGRDDAQDNVSRNQNSETDPKTNPKTNIVIPKNDQSVD